MSMGPAITVMYVCLSSTLSPGMGGLAESPKRLRPRRIGKDSQGALGMRANYPLCCPERSVVPARLCPGTTRPSGTSLEHEFSLTPFPGGLGILLKALCYGQVTTHSPPPAPGMPHCTVSPGSPSPPGARFIKWLLRTLPDPPSPPLSLRSPPPRPLLAVGCWLLAAGCRKLWLPNKRE